MEKQATSFTNVKLGRTARITASFKYHYSSPLWNKQLTVESKENNCHQIERKMAKPMSAQTGKTVEKIEVLTANYPIGVIDGVRNSVFAIFIGFEAEITGKILKKRLIFSKNIIEIIRLQYYFSKN